MTPHMLADDYKGYMECHYVFTLIEMLHPLSGSLSFVVKEKEYSLKLPQPLVFINV